MATSLTWAAVPINKHNQFNSIQSLLKVWLKLVQWFCRRNFVDVIIIFFFCYIIIMSHWKKECCFIWTILNSLHSRMLCANCKVKLKVEISQVVLEEQIYLNFIKVFSLFRYYLILEEVRALYSNKFESHSPKNACTKFGWNLPSGSGVIFFFKFRQSISLSIISISLLSPPQKGINLNSLHPWMLCAKFGWNWPSGLEKKIFKFC